jgi:hypothetical protein
MMCLSFRHIDMRTAAGSWMPRGTHGVRIHDAKSLNSGDWRWQSMPCHRHAELSIDKQSSVEALRGGAARTRR